MPSAPLKYCLAPGCNQRVRRGYCPTHQQAQRQSARRDAAGAVWLNYGRKWGKARLNFLAGHPWCKACAQQGKHVLATDVDHIEPHHWDAEKFWDVTGWQALCKSCHSSKTARENQPACQ